jgi:putative transposase
MAAVSDGARLFRACEEMQIDIRTYQRWKQQPAGDQRNGPLTEPANKLTEEERKKVLELVTAPEYRDLPPSQIVPRLADQGKYLASESTLYRILRKEKMLAHRGKAQPATNSRPDELVATAPNEVWSWDITYLKMCIRGMFSYAYLITDIFSRKITAGDVFEEESSELSSQLMREACLKEGIQPDQLSLHADNGGPMKGATMLATLQKLGVAASFSRPRVSDDNPFSEALFRTMKYRPEFPEKPFENLEDARTWLNEFIHWYNHEHLHSGIQFVTPADRHDGKDVQILENRKNVYEKAKNKNPLRWSRQIRNWDRVQEVSMHQLTNKKEDHMKMAA